MRIFIYALVVLLVVRCIAPGYSADCIQNVTKVKSGTIAPCDGWHVSEPTMQDIMKDKDQLELQKKLQLQMEHLRKLDLQELEYYQMQSKNNQKALEKSEQQKFWSNIGMFALGVVVTGFAAKVAIESTK